MKWRRMVYFTLIFLLFCFIKITAADDSNVINICLKDIGTPMENVRFEAYKVGILKENQPVIDNRFQIPVFPDKAYILDHTARKISEMLTEKANRIAMTDTSGFLSFDGLESGVYLIRMSGKNPYGKISPFLVFLPCFENGVEIHSIEVEPKASPPDKYTHETPAREQNSTASPGKVKTGDAAQIKPYVILAVLSLIICAVLLPERKIRKGEQS